MKEGSIRGGVGERGIRHPIKSNTGWWGREASGDLEVVVVGRGNGFVGGGGDGLSVSDCEVDDWGGGGKRHGDLETKDRNDTTFLSQGVLGLGSWIEFGSRKEEEENPKVNKGENKKKKKKKNKNKKKNHQKKKKGFRKKNAPQKANNKQKGRVSRGALFDRRRSSFLGVYKRGFWGGNYSGGRNCRCRHVCFVLGLDSVKLDCGFWEDFLWDFVGILWIWGEGWIL